MDIETGRVASALLGIPELPEYVQEREKGMERQKIELLCKKLRRAKSVEQIAEEREEDIGMIQGLCEAAASFAPDYDTEKIYEA